MGMPCGDFLVTIDLREAGGLSALAGYNAQQDSCLL
jgi:hypothetical protein